MGHAFFLGRELHIVAVLFGEEGVVTLGHHDCEILERHLHALFKPLCLVYLVGVEIDDVVLPHLVALRGLGQILKEFLDNLLRRPREEAEDASVKGDEPHPAPLSLLKALDEGTP